jgi:two-component system, OmpR family, KDP operon response regulator KdpE
LGNQPYNEKRKIVQRGKQVSGQTILVVDDDVDIINMVSHGLRQAGFGVITAMDGQTALRLLYEKRPDLVILDVMLPDPRLNGYTVCRRIREVSEVPVIMLTAQTNPEDIVEGLEAGADDYILKPYNKDVLIARVRANLRRAAAKTEPLFEKQGVAYSDGYLTVNLDERRVLRDGRQVKLSPTEFSLLIKLIENSPRVVTYRDLLNSVWGFEYADDIDYLRVYVWHLRRKLERDPKNPVYLANELGVGYRFEKQI